VGLQIPEDTRPEVKAIIKDNALRLQSKSAPEKIKAAQVLGELGEQGKPVRRLLCGAMLDASVNVRVAAADALKNIDPKLQYLAVALASEQDWFQRSRLLREVSKLEDDAEPLTPLVAAYAGQAVRSKDTNEYYLPGVVACLSHIARNDPSVFRLLVSALDNREAVVRHAALVALPRMKHGRQAVPKIIRVLQFDDLNRVAAIQALAALADESTEDAIRNAIAAQRYHQRAEVRRAVEVALNTLQNKQKP
jgi:HEAT repeat protein